MATGNFPGVIGDGTRNRIRKRKNTTQAHTSGVFNQFNQSYLSGIGSFSLLQGLICPYKEGSATSFLFAPMTFEPGGRLS